jgi:hypothetical protein
MNFWQVWFDRSVPNEKLFLQQFTLRLNDQYLQTNYYIGKSFKRSLYVNYQLTFGHEIYLDCVTVKRNRNALGKLRTSSHDLEIERWRYSDTTLKEIKECANFVILRLKVSFILF